MKKSFFIPFLIVAGGGLYLAWRWGAIPARFPIHWNGAGQIDGWAARSPLVVGAPLIVAAFLDALILGLAEYFVARMNRLYQGKAAGLEYKAHHGVRTTAIVMSSLLSAACVAIAAMMPLAGQTPAFIGLMIMCAIMGSFIFMIFILLMVGKATEVTEEERKAALANGTLDPALDRARRDARFWKWGLFYYNPDDPAVWVEKLYGGGWTTNMARRQSYYWLGGFLLFMVLVIGGVFIATRH